MWQIKYRICRQRNKQGSKHQTTKVREQRPYLIMAKRPRIYAIKETRVGRGQCLASTSVLVCSTKSYSSTSVFMQNNTSVLHNTSAIALSTTHYSSATTLSYKELQSTTPVLQRIRQVRYTIPFQSLSQVPLV